MARRGPLLSPTSGASGTRHGHQPRQRRMGGTGRVSCRGFQGWHLSQFPRCGSSSRCRPVRGGGGAWKQVQRRACDEGHPWDLRGGWELAGEHKDDGRPRRRWWTTAGAGDCRRREDATAAARSIAGGSAAERLTVEGGPHWETEKVDRREAAD